MKWEQAWLRPERLPRVGSSTSVGKITFQLPKAGTWHEMSNAGMLLYLNVSNDGDGQTIQVPSHFGMVFIRSA